MAILNRQAGSPALAKRNAEKRNIMTEWSWTAARLGGARLLGSRPSASETAHCETRIGQQYNFLAVCWQAIDAVLYQLTWRRSLPKQYCHKYNHCCRKPAASCGVSAGCGLLAAMQWRLAAMLAAAANNGVRQCRLALAAAGRNAGNGCYSAMAAETGWPAILVDIM